MHSNLDWNAPITWLTALALVALLSLQIWLIARNGSLSVSRKGLRAGLNGLLWLVMAAYFLQIRWQTTLPSGHALLVAADVPPAFVRSIKDSLHIRDSFTARNLKTGYDSITLVGQDFPAETVARLSQSAVRWIPYSPTDRWQEISWKGIVRQGELQRITGRIRSSRRQWLTVRYGSQRLDSVALRAGDNAFALQFPAFARGRTQTTLTLSQYAGANEPLDTIRFFTRPTRPLTVQFLLNNPDFESKTLADWLGKQGHTVYLSTTLSKNIGSTTSINKSVRTGANVPDLIITEPTNAPNAVVRKAVADGRSVLFINVANPETEGRVINQAVGSRVQVRKTSAEPVVPVGPNLNALPYRFTDAVNQFAVGEYPVVVQRTAGRVGVSLLSETFPLALSGDSVAYNRVWYAIMGLFQPVDNNTIQVNAPVFGGFPGTVGVNSPSGRPPGVRVGSDTVRLAYSPLNNRSAAGTVRSQQPGWQPIGDSLSVYVYPAKQRDLVTNRRMVSQFIRAHSRYQSATERVTRQTETQVPNGVWLLLFLICFTALWVEPKLV